ncbi:MAG: DUF202 domain-containing protein [Geodermatophilaceae bacterium]
MPPLRLCYSHYRTVDGGRVELFARRGEDPGLQPQRSALAWSRTSLAVTANAVLILQREIHQVAGLLTGLLALAIAAATLVIGRRRHVTLSQRPLPDGLAAPIPVHLLGWSVVVLSLVTCGLLVFA